nr:GNAT family N-acetyltransferase [Clostridia bacterium]
MLTRSRIRKVFANIPTLKTKRLTLRKLKPEDSEDMYEYSKIPEVSEYLLWSPHRSEDFTRDYLEQLQDQYRDGYFYDWAVVLPVRDGSSLYGVKQKMIGTCGFTSISLDNNAAEIGYVLNPAYWGYGFAPEAVKKVLEFGFEKMNFNRIEARYIVGNDRSLRVMQKCGMTFEGVKRELLYVKGEYKDIGGCAILRREYDAMIKNKMSF